MAISNTLQPGQRRDPFYAFNQFQRQAGKDMTTSPVVGGPSGYLEQNQDAAYNRYLASIGIRQSDMNPLARFARDQFAQTQTGYRTALAEDPTLTYLKYLEEIGLTPQVLRRQFQRLAPNLRGERQSQFVGPVRTISDI